MQVLIIGALSGALALAGRMAIARGIAIGPGNKNIRPTASFMRHNRCLFRQALVQGLYVFAQKSEVFARNRYLDKCQTLQIW